jgi:prepilin-type N-terminal cleavage/methylation domain-containing protein
MIQKQKGFTLVELLVALAVGTVILTGAAGAVYQLIKTTANTNSQVVVLDEINRVVLQLKKDLQSRESANISAGYDAITLHWVNQTAFEEECPQVYSITYSLSDSNLMRTSDNTTSIVARQIESISYNGTEDYVDVVVTATSSKFPYKSKTLSFRVYKRMEETE